MVSFLLLLSSEMSVSVKTQIEKKWGCCEILAFAFRTMLLQSTNFLAKKQANSSSTLVIEVILIPYINIENPWKFIELITAWKVSKYGVVSGPYFPAFGPEKTPYLDTFHTVFRFTTSKVALDI